VDEETAKFLLIGRGPITTMMNRPRLFT